MRTVLLAAALAIGMAPGAALAASATVGYQLVYNPWKVPIVRGEFEAATGYDIEWVRFSSGFEAIEAMAAGEVDIALAGSSPIAAGVSQGVDLLLFWIAEDIAAAEALVAREGAGIDRKNPPTLKGKRLGVPFVSTTHFHTLFALDIWSIDPSELEILDLQPLEIADAWERGEIDAAFVWEPVLGQLKDSGEVIITSGELSAMGKATFDGLVARRAFAEEHPEFMATFVKVVAEADAAYRENRELWTADSEEVEAIVSLVGGDAEDVPAVLATYGFPTMEEQVSEQWLGGGAEGGAAKALFYTADFLEAHGKIEGLLPDYGAVITPAYVEAAMKM